MSRTIPVALLLLFILLLSGCGEKLTAETAEQVINKEMFESRKVGTFFLVSFPQGTEGFEYFQKLIADGNFKLKKDETKPHFAFGDKKLRTRVYAPVKDLEKIYRALTVKDVLDLSQMTPDKLISQDKVDPPVVVVCEASVRFKKEAVLSVDSIFNDEKTGRAKVKFTAGEVAIEPYYSDICKVLAASGKHSSDCKLRKPYQTELELKKYDEGWTVALPGM